MTATLAIIPARGGSKGIPRKNLAKFGGKPLIAWTIEAALGCKSIQRLVVSTEDAEIAAVAGEYGAEIVRRPADLSGDDATSESALLHALEHLEQAEDYRPDLLVFLQCTSPLTQPEDIEGTIAALVQQGADTALAAVPFHYYLWKKDEGQGAVGVNHDKCLRLRRQEKTSQYLESGAVYVMRVEGFRKARHRFFGKTVLYEMPAARCLEIDEPDDLRLAELLLWRREEGRRLSGVPAAVRAVVLDFDGVFTDNRVLVLEDGSEGVFCNRSDGAALARLTQTGIPVLVLSAETSGVVAARCRKLGLECRQGCQDKLSAMRTWLAEREIPPEQTVYLGNDANDVACLGAVGCGVAVADAYPEALAAARVVLQNPGGSGAIRELVELLIAKREGRLGA